MPWGIIPFPKNSFGLPGNTHDQISTNIRSSVSNRGGSTVRVLLSVKVECSYAHHVHAVQRFNDCLLNGKTSGHSKRLRLVCHAAQDRKNDGKLRGEAVSCNGFPNVNQATVQVQRNLVFVNGKAVLADTPKTECSNREVPIPPDLALLAQKQKSKSVFVFSKKNGEMMTESSFRRLWEIIDARQKPSEDEIWEELQKDKDDPQKIDRHPWVKRILDFDVTPHQLRHTYATRCFEDGMDVKEVQRLLGHSDPAITMKIYIHYCETQRKENTYEKVRESRQLQAQ